MKLKKDGDRKLTVSIDQSRNSASTTLPFQKQPLPCSFHMIAKSYNHFATSDIKPRLKTARSETARKICTLKIHMHSYFKCLLEERTRRNVCASSRHIFHFHHVPGRLHSFSSFSFPWDSRFFH